MEKYSFTYVNDCGNGYIVDEKEFSSDEEARAHGMQLLEIAMRDDQRENAPMTPYVIVDKLADDDDDPIALFDCHQPQKMTWEEYNASEQDTYLDEDNAADQEVVYTNDIYDVRVFKTFSDESDHYFSGEDEDFVIIDSKDGTQESYLLYGCTIEDAIFYIENND